MIMDIQSSISLLKNQEKIRHTYKVMIDREEGDYLIGRTEFDSPEVDNEVLIKKGNHLIEPGTFHQVHIIDADTYDLTGMIVI